MMCTEKEKLKKVLCICAWSEMQSEKERERTEEIVILPVSSHLCHFISGLHKEHLDYLQYTVYVDGHFIRFLSAQRS